MENERESEIWTNLGKFGQGIKLEKWKKEAKRIRKGNKNLSGN